MFQWCIITTFNYCSQDLMDRAIKILSYLSDWLICASITGIYQPYTHHGFLPHGNLRKDLPIRETNNTAVNGITEHLQVLIVFIAPMG